jgi:hypothetical protein
LIATQPVQRHDQWILLIFADLRRHKHRVRQLLVRVCERVHTLLNPRIDGAASTASTRRSRSARHRLLSGLLRMLNLCRRNQESRGQRNRSGLLDKK